MKRKIIKDHVFRCPHCDNPVHRWRICELSQKKLSRKYVFTEYEKCEQCDYIKLDNDYKININELK